MEGCVGCFESAGEGVAEEGCEGEDGESGGSRREHVCGGGVEEEVNFVSLLLLFASHFV